MKTLAQYRLSTALVAGLLASLLGGCKLEQAAGTYFADVQHSSLDLVLSKEATAQLIAVHNGPAKKNPASTLAVLCSTALNPGLMVNFDGYVSNHCPPGGVCYLPNPPYVPHPGSAEAANCNRIFGGSPSTLKAALESHGVNDGVCLWLRDNAHGGMTWSASTASPCGHVPGFQQ